MNSDLENNYKILREIQNNPNSSQRKISERSWF